MYIYKMYIYIQYTYRSSIKKYRLHGQKSVVSNLRNLSQCLAELPIHLGVRPGTLRLARPWNGIIRLPDIRCNLFQIYEP